jgi:two-component system, cell cycle sensor histidine kinase and response regulator CckA
MTSAKTPANLAQHLEALLDDAPVIVWETTVPDLHFTFVSQHAQTLLGFPVQRWLGDPSFFASLIHPEDRERALTECAEATKLGRDHELEYRMRTADGRWIWLHDAVRVVLDGEGRAVRLRGAMVDITPRKRTEALLRETQDAFDLLADNLEQVFWVRTAVEMIYVSPAYEQVWGRPTSTLYDNPDGFRDLVHPEDRARIELEFAACVEGRRPFDAEYRIVRDDGQVRWIHARSSIVLDGQGRFLREAGVAEDVTERRAVEASMQHTQKLESLGVLAGGIAHDFNNLLVGILGHAELAEQSGASGEHVRQIQAGAEHAADLCRQMLAYAGHGNYEVTRVDLRGVVSEIGGLIEASVAKGAALVRDFPEHLSPVQGDAVQLRQVLLNLVTNASDALDGRPGTIHLRLSEEDLEPEALRTSYLDDDLPGGRYVRLMVEDDGVGMTEETRAKLFDPFFSTKFTGRGLGLATLLGIARAHRAAIQVESEPGRGTRFSLLFPAAAGEPVQQSDRAPEVGRVSGRVLVVDDEPSVRRVAAQILRRAGFEVSTASSGLRALEHLAGDPVDVVLLDLTMPDLHGLEVLARLRKAAPDLPVVLNSGYDPRERNAEDGALAGCRFLRKPYRSRDLIAVVAGALGDRELASDSGALRDGQP